MRVFGLTGGIACGKSFVASILARRGYPVVDADAISREILRPGTPAFDETVTAFGPDIVASDGAVDRRKLGAVVFSDPVARKRLEGITHPAITASIDAELDALHRSGAKAVFVEATLVFETGRTGRFEKVVAVLCDRETQIRRLTDRDGITRSEAESRLAAQMDPAEKARRSDFVVDTGGTEADTAARVEDLLLRLNLSSDRE